MKNRKFSVALATVAIIFSNVASNTLLGGPTPICYTKSVSEILDKHCPGSEGISGCVRQTYYSCDTGQPILAVCVVTYDPTMCGSTGLTAEVKRVMELMLCDLWGSDCGAVYHTEEDDCVEADLQNFTIPC